MLITGEQLKACMPYATPQNITAFLLPLNQACEKYSINTPLRVAAFLAQLAHESGCLRYTTELASGKAYDTGKLASALGNTPEADGDGEKYKGRGLIQITGLANYKRLSKEIGIDYVSTPSFLCRPADAALSAGWFWNDRKLNMAADREDFRRVTYKINGGYNHYAERLAFYVRARKAFGLSEWKGTESVTTS